MPKLILVPTPIGNLEDASDRIRNTLSNADVILAEDTRHTGKLLNLLGIEGKMKSYHKFNEHKMLDAYLQTISENEVTALVSDAGTPGISDPGFLIVRSCIESGIEVECLPGPTAFIPALVVSGFSTERFCFEGFLPQKKGRQKRITALIDEERTMVFYESPYRISKFLKELSEHMGSERRVSISREISKKFEETIRGKLVDLIPVFEDKKNKGEFVVVVEGKQN